MTETTAVEDIRVLEDPARKSEAGILTVDELYHSLESKLTSVQESLGVVLDVARDRRLVLLETTVVLLILFEIVLALFELT